MIQRILAPIVLVFCTFGLQCSLSLDELCKGLLYDVSHNQPIDESLELLKQQKDVLTYVYNGKILLKHVADDLSGVLREQKTIERALENNPNDENLQARLMAESIKERSLLETFAALLKLGKGDDAFEKSLPLFMESIKERPSYSPCVVMLQDAFSEMFPEPIEAEDGGAAEAEVDDEEEDPVFVQPSQESLIQAFRLQHFLLKLSKQDFYVIDSYAFTDKDLFERDLSGKSLIRYIAECWYHEIPKTDDERKGIVRTRNGWYQSTWELQERMSRCGEIRNLFLKVLNKTLEAIERDIPNRAKLYEALMDDLLENEENYKPLLDALGQSMQNSFNAHRALRKVTPAVSPAIAQEKVYAYEVADLFYALLEGDAELSNAFEIIKEKPYLVNACEPGGLSILHMVLLEYGNAWHKRKDLALFFDYLLLNGADAKKECTIQTEVTEIVQGAYSWMNQQVTKVVTKQLPSVAGLLADHFLYAVPVLPDGHPYKSGYRTVFNMRIDGQTAQFFNDRLAKFTSGETARFETNEGEWLRDMMPEPPVVKEKNESDDQEGDEQDQAEQAEDEKEALKDLLNQGQQGPPQKSTWEKWKPSLTYFVAGATMSGLAYWLGTRSWGDPHEELRQERQRVRAART